MKTFFVLVSCLVVLGCNSATTPVRTNTLHQRNVQPRFEIDVEALENAFNDFINQLKPFDPLDVPERVIEFGRNKATFKNIHVEGFTNIDTDLKVDVGILSADVGATLLLPKLVASVESWESDFPVAFGKGDATITINNLKLSINVEYSYFSGFKPSKVSIDIESADAHVTGIQNNAELSQEINNKIVEFLNTTINSEEFHSKLGQAIDRLLEAITKSQ
ncbi:hypothetical protein FQA39_LY07886 [Lamprigera yunnana]|nr:hypothetical protein FQA39_LY07886 [Lamprigera yunnana]